MDNSPKIKSSVSVLLNIGSDGSALSTWSI